MRNFIVFALLALFSGASSSALNLDVYGVNEALKKKIVTNCDKDITQYVESIRAMHLAQGDIENKTSLAKNLETRVLAKINSFGDFSFVNISTVEYPDDNSTYTTVDIVDSRERYRFPKSPQRVIKKDIKRKELKPLFTLWDEYNENNLTVLKQGQFTSKPCPIMHCTWGFNAMELKKYLPKFKADVVKYKKQLFDVIQYGDNDSERATAIFLLAHHNNDNEIAHFLINYIDDSNSSVRNNTMRVLGAIASQHKIDELPLKKILAALDYPYVTDRNKAAYVLYNIALKNKSTHQQIVRNSGDTLIKLLQLKQPNNHDFAYNILKVISRKNYSGDTIENWQKWIDATKKTIS